MINAAMTDVVSRAQQGDIHAFETIVAQWRRRAMGMIARMVGRPEDAEDIAQDVSCAYISRSTSYAKPRSLSRGCIA